MRLTASDIVSLYRPTPCSLRVYLREKGVPEAEPSVFEQILQTLGQRHEEAHLATLGAYEDLSVVPPDERVEQTAAAIRNRVPVIYQGEFAVRNSSWRHVRHHRWSPRLSDSRRGWLLIRDSKLSRQVDDDHHEEITLQLQLYGWLFEQTVGAPCQATRSAYAARVTSWMCRMTAGAAALAELATHS